MNEKMLSKHAPDLHRNAMAIGNPGDTGSGILMGLGAGGHAINMHEGFVSLPYYPPASLTFGILVNDKGQRFINEDCYHGRVGWHARQQPGDRIYLVASVEDYGDYETVSYLGAGIAGTGETIEELEQELELPPGTLAHTLRYYNEHAAQGEDPLLHKAAEYLKPMTAPYVALDCTPGRGAFYPFFTRGGLDTLPSVEVVTAQREPTPASMPPAAPPVACPGAPTDTARAFPWAMPPSAAGPRAEPSPPLLAASGPSPWRRPWTADSCPGLAPGQADQSTG